MIDFTQPIPQQAKFTARVLELTVNYNVSEINHEYEFDNVIFGYINNGKKVVHFSDDTAIELQPNTIAMGSTKASANVLIKEVSIENPILCFRLDIARDRVWNVLEKINETYSLPVLIKEEQQIPSLDLYFGKAGREVFNTLKKIQQLLMEDVTFKDYWIDLKIEELILHCLQTNMRQTLITSYHKNSLQDHPLAYAVHYVKENLYGEIEIAGLANKSFMSKATFYRQFKHYFGMTPTAFIHAERIKEAQKLLGKTDKSISEIGYCLGYSSPSYFAQQFERITGCAPKKYKASLQAKK